MSPANSSNHDSTEGVPGDNPEPSNALSGFRVAALVDDHFEQAELTSPKAALELAGARVAIVSRNPLLTGMEHLAPRRSFTADVALDQARAEDFDALLLPGGVVNGDSLRIVPEAQRLARALVEQGKPVAVICHGGWLLISSGLVNGRTLTSWPTLRDDYTNAGARWLDRPVVVDGNWVSSRKPSDLDAFNRALIEVFAHDRDRRQRAA